MNIYSLKNKGVAGNIWKYALLSITNKRTYLTFFSIFLLTLPNTTAQTIGFVSFMGHLFGFIFEIPSGYLSDRIGHRKALIIAKCAFLFSTSILIFADQIIYFIISSILMALAFAMTSGTSSVFFHETLSELGLEKRYSEIKGKISSLGFAVPAALIILMPLIAENYGYK